MSEAHQPVVHVRTPTYRRPSALLRALQSLQAQTCQDWVCDVYDDDPDRSAEAVCRQLNDPRIFYNHNVPQAFASRNIDQCFSRANPRAARYFFVLEDDNLVFETFMAENIAICEQADVNLVLRNQIVEFASNTPQAHFGSSGILDGLFINGLYEPQVFRQSLLMGIGVSNGGLFWTSSALSDLETPYNCTATMQEYLRTFSVREPIYVAMKPLAVWAENAEQTTRNAGLNSSYLRRELNLKRNLQVIRQHVWREMVQEARRTFLDDKRFSTDRSKRAEILLKSRILTGLGDEIAIWKAAKLLSRAILVALLGRQDSELAHFLQQRTATFV